MASINKELKRKSQQIYNELLDLQTKVEENDLSNIDWYIEFINKLDVYVNG